jgi:hypothetical protein
VDPRLEHDVPLALGPDGALDGGQDLGPADVEMASSACLTWSVMASLRPMGTMFWAGSSGLSSWSTTQPNSAMAPWVVNTRPTSMSPLLRAEVVRGPPASSALNSLKSSMP